MTSRFTPLALIRGSQDGGRTRPARRPPRRTQTRARFRLEALEDRCLLSGISGYTEFPLPSGSSAFGITAGPDGNLWFTDAGAGKIGMINPTTHAISEFATPTANSHPYGITAGPDGNLWFTEYAASKIGMINPTTHAVTEFATPTTGSVPRGITAGPDGNLWFTESAIHKVAEINPTTHAITEFSVPDNFDPLPYEIAAGPDGNLWFTETFGGEIGEINPTTHAFTMFVLPNAGYGSRPICVTAGPDGNLWFTDEGSNGGPFDSASVVGIINPTTDAITEFATPTANSGPAGITAGPDGNLWFTEAAGQIGRINPTTDAIIEYPVPAGSRITAGPDGNLWFTNGGSIGVATLVTSELAVTQQPPSSITAGSPFGLTVEAEDSSGDLLSSFDGTVTVALASNPGGATLGGTLTATASNGVATFSGLSLTAAASGYTLQDSASGLGGATTSAFTVTPTAATQVAITQEPPASVTAGSGFGLIASIEDAYGNVETGDNATVTLALASNPRGATLGGTLSVTASNGVATFSGLTLTSAASGYTLQASTSGLSSATTSAITVTPAAATQVVIAQQPPASVVVNASFGLIATIEDTYGNVVTSASSTVKVALSNNPTGAKLGGTLSVKASKGVATFSGLTISKAGSGYTLALSSSGLTGATTSPITVTKTGADTVLAAPAGSSAPNSLLAPLVLDSTELFDSLGLKKRSHSV